MISGVVSSVKHFGMSKMIVFVEHYVLCRNLFSTKGKCQGNWPWCNLIGWLVVLRIYVALAVFQPYRDLEAGDNQSLKFKWRDRESNPGPLSPQAKSLTIAAPGVTWKGIISGVRMPNMNSFKGSIAIAKIKSWPSSDKLYRETNRQTDKSWHKTTTLAGRQSSLNRSHG